MKPALFLPGVFPPPATGAFRLSRAHGARTGGATDRQESFLVQRIGGNFMEDGEILRGLAGPIDQWIALEQIVGWVGANKTDVAAIRRLVGPQARDPALRACKRPPERLDFAHVATGDAGLFGTIEAIDALRRHERLKRPMLRIDRPNAAAITLLGLFPGRVGFRK